MKQGLVRVSFQDILGLTKSKPAVTSIFGFWTFVLKAQLWHGRCCHIGILKPQVHKVGPEGGAEEDILIGSDAVVVTCRSQGSHALKHTLLYRLFLL